jgi:hypothetical protein
MVVHFSLIGQVLEQTGSSRQKTLVFQYFDSRLLALANLDLLHYETDENQMRTKGTYMVQGTASVKDRAKPKVTFYMLLA